MIADPLPALASAAEGSRELDALVAEAAGWKQARDGLWNRPKDVAEARRKKVGMLNYRPRPLPAFTTSVDAALTLLPEGWLWRLGFNGKEHCFDAHPPMATVGTPAWNHVEGRHAEKALAIVLAALKARTQNDE